MNGESIRPQPKPAKGAHRIKTIRQTISAENTEKLEKAAAKKRDGHCRWPHSRGERGVCRRMRLEAAHYLAKSLGGANAQKNLITFCVEIHQGPVSLHSGDLRVVPLTLDQMDGPCAFEAKAKRGWVVVGRESSIGVLAR